MDDYSYMCGECFQFWDSNERFIHHICHANMDNTSAQENRIELQKRDKAKATYAGPESSESVVTDSAIVHISNEELCDQTQLKSTVKTVVTAEDEDTIVEGEGKKRKKYQAMADEYRVNRIMRDKDFKLGRTHLYSFKDTLGDWDERSTKLLIQLVHKYPKSHFLLSAKAERRLEHWEGIHQEMETAGYTFTVLQLRMRWREVLQKYRWTVDYNDDHEIKKKCEYFDEMNELFGDWDEEATRCLLKQMHQINLENNKKKIVRIGFAGWERITSSLNSDGHRFTIDMVEARWRNLVTLYKTMVDHNALPNVEPHSVAYKEELETLMTYIPKRRHTYEKVKGRSVKMERFPTNGVKVLLQAYKDCIGLFMDQKTRNASVWDQIKQNLEEEGYKYTTVKLKDILNGIIKGYEKSQYHNSLPGAIRRDVPYYRELSEIYGVHGRWPHIQISRSMDMRNKRKFCLRLQASQQLWSSKESRALLEIYPDILEAHVNQNISHQASDLWLQVAKAYAATGFAKRDVPEIAVHVGLLRLGYTQGNLFPFVEEMRKVKETEEAVCYSPDVSKFMGDVEVIYWSHEAVKHLLDLYLKHQESVTAQSRNGVFNKIRDDMQSLGYGYTKDQIYDHFKTLITQYRTRTSKLWGETVSSRKSSNPTGAPYLEKLEKVWQLRRKMSLSWTSGVSPLSDEALCIVYKVACEKAEELFINSSCTDEKKIVPQLIEQVQSYIRTKKLLEDVPRSRQIRLHLVSALKRFLERKEQNCFIAKLHKLLEANDMTNFYTNLKKQEVPNFADRSVKRRRKCQASSKKRRGKKRRPLEYEKSLTDDDSSDDIYHSGIFDDEPSSPLVSQISERGCSSSSTSTSSSSSSSSNRCVEKSNQYTQSKFDMTCDLEKQNEDNLYNIDISKTEGDCTSCQTGDKKESYGGKCPVKERKGRYGGLSAVVNEDSVQHAVLELEDNEEGGFSYVKCYTNTKKAEGGCRKNCGKVVIKTSVKANKIRNNSKSDITLDLSKELYSTDCSDSFITESERKYFNSRKRENKVYNDCSISNISESDSFNFNEDSFGDKLEHESLYEKVKGEPETRVIHTRSGRKTRFTFFTDSLNENFEDEVRNNGHDSIYVSEEPCVKNKQVDKSTQSDVGTPSKRKRGRPCKPKQPKSPFYCEVEDDGVSLIANVGSTNKGTRKGKRGRPCKVRETTNVSYDSLVNDERCLIKNEESSNESYPSSTKLRDKETNSGKSELINTLDYVLEMYQAERKEKENELLDVVEKHQAEQSIVLKQMLYFFENLKCTGKLDSTIG